MQNDLLAVFEYFEKEKGIDRETMVEALESALLTASRKSIGPARELRIDIDPDKGTIKAIATLIATENPTKPYDELPLATAQKIKADAVEGDEVDVEVTPANFGRIAAQTAKQAMMQRLRQAEKAMIYDEFKDRAGDIVSGTVRRFERSDVIVDLGKFEGIMPSRERVQTEDYSVGDRIRTYVVAVENGSRGPEIILSRSHPNFVRRLFEAEVSEIADRTVEIKAIARESGYRTKVAVHSSDEKVDPVGACVGLRGARVKNIVRELNNEKVDIIRWLPDVKEFVTDALKPAVIRSIRVDEGERKVFITVDEEELSKAIGRRGQNARLTSRLVGWDVQVERDASKEEQFDARVMEAAQAMADALGVDLAMGEKLVRGGVLSADMVEGLDAEDLSEILEIDEAEAGAILARVGGSSDGGNGDHSGAGSGDADEASSEEVSKEEPSGETNEK